MYLYSFKEVLSFKNCEDNVKKKGKDFHGVTAIEIESGYKTQK